MGDALYFLGQKGTSAQKENRARGEHGRGDSDAFGDSCPQEFGVRSAEASAPTSGYVSLTRT